MRRRGWWSPLLAEREAFKPPAVQEVPATRLVGAVARYRSARHSRRQGWSGSSEHPPPAGGQSRLVGHRCGLHAGGEEQGADRHPALKAGIHLAGRPDPVGQLTGANKGRGEKDLACEQAMGGGRAEQPQQGVHGARGRRVLWLLQRARQEPRVSGAQPAQTRCWRTAARAFFWTKGAPRRTSRCDTAIWLICSCAAAARRESPSRTVSRGALAWAPAAAKKADLTPAARASMLAWTT